MEELSLYIVTYNCARNVVHREQFPTHLFDVLPQSRAAPELLVLSLQEVAPIAYAFLGGSSLDSYFEALDAAVNVAAHLRWPDDQVSFVSKVTHSCGLTALVVFARSDVADRIAWTDTAEVGVGVHEMGNKGAVGARLGYTTRENETVEVTFVAAHLTPMEDAYGQRNRDWRSIVERLVFTNSDGAQGQAVPEEGAVNDDAEDTDEGVGLLRERSRRQSGMFTPRSHLFVAGDLNYRTADVPPSPEDFARFPQPEASEDDPRHHSRLLAHDQLSRERRSQNTLHGLSEAPIEFPPTYKYSSQAQRASLIEQEPKVWQWARHRWPSWCDRILYLDLPPWMAERGIIEHVQVYGYDALPLFCTSDHRAVSLAVSVPLKPIPPPPSPSSTDDVRLQPPYALDPTWRARRATAQTKEVIVGGLSYLTLTREGNGLLLAATIGMIGGWLVLRSLLQGDN